MNDWEEEDEDSGKHHLTDDEAQIYNSEASDKDSEYEITFDAFESGESFTGEDRIWHH